METQLSFLEPRQETGRSRRADPVTAKQAARKVAAPRLEQVVLDALRGTDGLTSEEIAARTGLSLVTVSPRLRPLVNKGLVEDSGQTRRNVSGRAAIIWKKCGGDRQ